MTPNRSASTENLARYSPFRTNSLELTGKPGNAPPTNRSDRAAREPHVARDAELAHQAHLVSGRGFDVDRQFVADLLQRQLGQEEQEHLALAGAQRT